MADLDAWFCPRCGQDIVSQGPPMVCPRCDFWLGGNDDDVDD